MNSNKGSRHQATHGKQTTPKVSRANTARKFRGLTCANCRARKIRCEGGPPTCKTCEVFHDECRYDKTPPVSQVVALARRLQEAEEELAQVRAASRTSQSPASMSTPHRERDAETHQEDQRHWELGAGKSPSFNDDIRIDSNTDSQAIDNDTLATPALSSSDTGSQARPAAQDPQAQRIPPAPPYQAQVQPLGRQHHSVPSANNQSAEPTAPHLSLDEHGEICYYGPTSAVHDPPQLEPSESQAVATESMTAASTGGSREEATVSVRSAIAAHARESATWEEFALGNASLETGIPQSVIARLLHMHWTWVSPMFNWVYRPAFVRDMATGGRYYSEFLLTVICAHAAKYQDASFADILLTRARRLLGDAVQKPSSIPTVQALLQLSARDLAHGSISQAWVYSGIAFRMASDLGLQHSGPGIRGIGAVDLEIRRRLFWSCYFWDKATSLYAGRLPAVTEVLHPDTLDLLDDYTEDEAWYPYYGDTLHLTNLNRPEYPPMKSHLVSCFVNSCRLAIIINDVILQLYSRRGRSITEDVVRDIKTKLDAWRSNSPAHLKYDPDDLPPVSPPPHIIAQNLLYYTTVILAHRPMWSVSAYYEVCIDASKSIEKLILLLESTFGLGNITYLMGYCIYTGASAILEDAKSGQPAAHGILRTYLRALNAGMRKCPLLERSLNIIVKGLNRADFPTTSKTMRPSRMDEPWTTPSRHYASSSSYIAPAAGAANFSSMNAMQVQPPEVIGHHETGLPNGANHANSYIPAFPYLGPEMPLDFGMSQAHFGMGPHIDSMAVLDCFPEMQMDMGELICSSSAI